MTSQPNADRAGETSGPSVPSPRVHVRESINRHKGAAVALTLLLTAAAVGGSLYFSHHETAQFGTIQDKAWFTEDDGKTYFADTLTRQSPFDHNGKQAYRCFVFACDGGKPYVAYLERDNRQASPSTSPASRSAPPVFAEVKPVGTGEDGWVGQTTTEGTSLITKACADGKLAKPVSP